MKYPIVLISIIFLAVLVLLPTISAATFDNVKGDLEFGPGISDYGKITIKNWFGLTDLATLELKENTDVCGKDCSADIEIILHNDVPLIDDVKFIDMDTGKETEIDSYQFYVDGNPYKLGTEMNPGTYQVRLDGIKNPWSTVDWQITSQGKLIDDWAVWSSSLNVNLSIYYSFDINTTDNSVRDATILYDLDANEGTPVLGDEGCLIGNCLNLSTDNNLRFPNGETFFDIFAGNKTWNWWAYKTVDDVGNHFMGSTSDEAVFQWSASGDRFGWESLKQGGGQAYTTPEPLGRWVMVTTVVNDTNFTMYVNGSRVIMEEAWRGKSTTDMRLGTETTGALDWNGRVDEFSIWNRTLSASEILNLYNAGAGLAYVQSPSPVIVTLNSPLNNTIQTNITISFNSTITIDPGGTQDIKNATVYIWYSNLTLANKTTLVVTGSIQNTSLINITGLIPENYLWNVRGCAENATGATCNFATDNRTFSYGATVNKINWNATIYETETGTFSANITTPSSYVPNNGKLYYNGTSYSATVTASGDEYIISRSIDIPVVPSNSQNRSFHLSWNLGSGTFNSSITQQNVTKINMSICSPTIDTPFINFTFVDETNSAILNASADLATWEYWLGSGDVTKTLSYTNTTENKKYTFCFSPNDKTLKNNLTFQYSASGYPQRRHVRSSDLTSTLTTQILYLLSSEDGSTVAFQVQNTAGGGIVGVNVNVEIEFSGIFTSIGGDITDSSGVASFFLNPNQVHRVTFIKGGFDTQILTIRPTQSVYTVVMSGGEVEPKYVSDIEGINWNIFPLSSTVLDSQTEYVFTYNITSNKSNLVSYKIELYDNDLNLLDSASGSISVGSNLSITLNTSTETQIIGKYFYNLGNGTFQNDLRTWQVLTITAGGSSLTNFFTTIDMSNMELQGKFTAFTIFFLILFIGVAALTRATGMEIVMRGIALPIVLALVWIVSFGGFFTINFTTNAFVNQYFAALAMTALIGGFSLGQMRKT